MYGRAESISNSSAQGILRPDWLTGAEYLGDEVIDGDFATHIFTKAEFITYYESVETGLPVRWFFHESGMHFEVMRWDVGALPAESEWNVPLSCFGGELPFVRDISMENISLTRGV